MFYSNSSKLTLNGLQQHTLCCEILRGPTTIFLTAFYLRPSNSLAGTSSATAWGRTTHLYLRHGHTQLLRFVLAALTALTCAVVMPPDTAHAVKTCKVLQQAGEAVLAALTKSPTLNVKTTAFSDILDDPVLKADQVSSSVLDAIQYLDLSITSGCHPHFDKGLLTLVTADADGLQVLRVPTQGCLPRGLRKPEKTICSCAWRVMQVYSEEQHSFQPVCIPPGHIAILPGYTLERATCGLIKAALHQVVSVLLAYALHACLRPSVCLYMCNIPCCILYR